MNTQNTTIIESPRSWSGSSDPPNGKPLQKLSEAEAKALGLNPEEDLLLMRREWKYLKYSEVYSSIYLHFRVGGGNIFYELRHKYHTHGSNSSTEYYLLSKASAEIILWMGLEEYSERRVIFMSERVKELFPEEVFKLLYRV